MADPDQLLDQGDDDWVREMLAQALLEQSEPVGREPDDAPDPAVTSRLVDRPTFDATDDPGPDDAPDPAVTSRLVERPTFDATDEPGVDTMISAEQEPSATPTSNDSVERSSLRGIVEWLVVLGSAVIVALLLRAFLFQAFYIPSESMEETLRVDDRVLVNKFGYQLHDVRRGDVIVFRRPDEDRGEFRDLIKRVIGLPGETIEGRDNTVFIDGQALIEPYLTPGEVTGDFGPVEIPDGELFVMGDNRDNSGDSRVFGTIETDRVIGRAFFLFWPFDRAGSV